MLEIFKKFELKNPRIGQGMIEYILVFVAVVVILIVVLGPGGMYSDSIDQSLDVGVRGISCMALEVCYDSAGCPAVCGNGCCEPGENPSSCNADCF